MSVDSSGAIAYLQTIFNDMKSEQKVSHVEHAFIVYAHLSFVACRVQLEIVANIASSA